MFASRSHPGLRRQHRGRLTAGLLLITFWSAIALGGASTTAAADSPQTAVLDWNKHALDALANAPTAATPGAGMAAPVQGVHLAMVQGAVYDAVNSIAGGYEPYLDVPAAPSSASQAAATATAAHDVLVAVLNQTPLTATFTATVRQAIIDRLDVLEDDSIADATVADGAAAVADGVDAGEAAAAAMIAARAGDGRWGAFRFTCGEEPGQWRPTTSTVCTTPSGPSDPFAWVAKVAPFVVESNEQFLSEGPPALKSGAYAKEYNEVKTLGAQGSQRTTEQQALVDFFQANPVEMYNRSFRTYALGRGSTSRSKLASSPSSPSPVETRSSPAGRTRRTGVTGARLRRSASELTTETGRRTGTRRGPRPSPLRPIRTCRPATTARPGRLWRSPSSTSGTGGRPSRSCIRPGSCVRTGTFATSATTPSTPASTRGSTSVQPMSTGSARSRTSPAG